MAARESDGLDFGEVLARADALHLARRRGHLLRAAVVVISLEAVALMGLLWLRVSEPAGACGDSAPAIFSERA
jgi:hypothetical protein